MEDFPRVTLEVSAAYQDLRLDKFLAQHLESCSRTHVQSLILQGHVRLLPQDEVVQNKKHLVAPGEIYSVGLPPPPPCALVPQSMPLHIYYEDDDVMVLEKPAGMVVHPSPGHGKDTLVHGLLAHCGENLSQGSHMSKPGIVHRLDKETSGLLVTAKHDVAHDRLSQQFAARTVEKRYWAFVWRTMDPPSGSVRTYVGPHATHPFKRSILPLKHPRGKEAVTLYRTLASLPQEGGPRPRFSLVECSIKTGRTHQIRLHCTHKGCPIMGDKLYGLPLSFHENLKGPYALARHGLHAHFLHFLHPMTQKPLYFHSPLPPDLLPLWELLGKPALS